ncbi:MAG: DedA family protein [Chloroflexi bacterium]|nr:MAG: DedA family protein [Chloroflexota bacterium]
MTFLAGFSGTVALLLLCFLLFSEEAGVPLPFAPGELVLIAAGLLIASGSLTWWLFVPLAWVACGGGAAIGYEWARALGAPGLEALAERLGAGRSLRRVEDRLRAAGPMGIAVSRLIPGLRIYTTLAAGAVRVDRRQFLLGALPAMAVWVVIFTVLGAVVGIPAEHFFTNIEKLALRGALLIVAGVGAWVAVRRVPPISREDHILLDTPGVWRFAMAVAIDLVIVACIVVGLGALARGIAGVGEGAGWVEVLAVLATVAVFYVVITRRGVGATAGERLLNLTYRRRGQSAQTTAATQPHW